MKFKRDAFMVLLLMYALVVWHVIDDAWFIRKLFVRAQKYTVFNSLGHKMFPTISTRKRMKMAKIMLQCARGPNE